MQAENYKAKFPKAFPKLTDDQMKAIGKVAQCKTYQDGDVLFKAGATDFVFHVIQKGEIKVIDRSGDEPTEILVHEQYEFTGDIANLSGRSSNVEGVAKGKVEVYEICTEELRAIISQEPDLSDIILKAFMARGKALQESDFTGIRVIGNELSEDTFRLRDFLSKNRVIFTWTEFDSDEEVSNLLKRFNVKESDLPIVAYGHEWILRNPTNLQLAEKIGLKQEIEDAVYDLVVVGAGPAGLAAAVYGASEGLKTVVLERMAAGGQAGHSSKIENYLGFPTGISGADLAERATMQAEKFGARLSVPALVVSLKFEGDKNVLELDNGEKVISKTLLIASGAEYRKLPIENLENYEGRGVYYAATQMEATMCGKSKVAIVGGGNSAGQAAVFLSGQVERIYLIIRGEALSETMSNYLDQRIRECSNIELLTTTEITAIKGKDHPEAVEIINNETKQNSELKVSAIFSFIGAHPCTGWLPDEIEKDEKGFIKTGIAIYDSPTWKEKRSPFLLETTRPGVFAAGDVRSNSVKRVSSAVGDGSMAIQFVHEFLKHYPQATTQQSSK